MDLALVDLVKKRGHFLLSSYGVEMGFPYLDQLRKALYVKTL